MRRVTKLNILYRSDGSRVKKWLYIITEALEKKNNYPEIAPGYRGDDGKIALGYRGNDGEKALGNRGDDGELASGYRGDKRRNSSGISRR
jgi:hypothetical protein